MKLFAKYLVSFSILSILLAPTVAVRALSLEDAYGGSDKKSEVATALGNPTYKDPRTMVASAITIALGFLGIIATIIILYAGFKWMTAGGDSKGVDAAKQLMINGVAGLVIILSAWALSEFVLKNVLNATGNTTS